MRNEIGSATLQIKLAQQVACWLSYELHAVPILLRKGASGVDRTPGTSRVTAMEIDLTHLLGDRIKALTVGDRFHSCSRPTVHGFVVTIRDRHVHACVSVRRRADDNVVLSDAQSPSVIVARADIFER